MHASYMWTLCKLMGRRHLGWLILSTSEEDPNLYLVFGGNRLLLRRVSVTIQLNNASVNLTILFNGKMRRGAVESDGQTRPG